MKTGRFVILALFLSVPGVFAQVTTGTISGTAKDETGPRISLTSPLAAPGERAVVAIRVDGIAGKSVLGLKLDVEFPGRLLKFVAARPAFRQDTLSVKATLVPPVDPKAQAQLSVTAASAKPIASGDVVELVFEVSKTVYTDQDAVVTPRSVSLQTLEGAAVENLPSKAGTVRISMASVVFACFFYMH